MNRIFTTIAVLLLLLNALKAQEETTKSNAKGFYINYGAGYSFPILNSDVSSPRDEVGHYILEATDSTLSQKRSFSSHGAGFQTSLSLGYMFKDYIGVELYMDYFHDTKGIDSRTDETKTGKRFFAEQSSYTDVFSLTPMIVLSGPSSHKFVPYVKLGVMVPLAGVVTSDLVFDDEQGRLADLMLLVIDPNLQPLLDLSNNLNIPIAMQAEIKAKSYGSASYGFKAVLGCDYQLPKNISLFAACNLNFMDINPKKTEIVKFKAWGDPEMVALVRDLQANGTLPNTFTLKDVYTESDLPQQLLLTYYRKEISENTNSTYNASRRDEPLEQLTFKDPYNAIGLQLGIKYRF